MSTIDERRANRNRFIQLVYEKANGTCLKGVHAFDVGDELGLTRPDVDDFAIFWTRKRYIDMTLDRVLRMTADGIVFVEEGLPKTTTRQGVRPSVGDTVVAKRPKPAIVPAQDYPKETRIFLNQGKTWLVVYEGVPKSVGDSVGMWYIRHLLQSPGQEIHALVLQVSVAGEEDIPVLGSAGAMLDDQALSEYRERISEIDRDLAEAESDNDRARMERYSRERQALYEEIGRATGLGGRTREAASDRERARKAVSAAIHRALKAIKDEHEPIHKHLDVFLNIGEFLSYQPDKPTTWQT